MPYPLPLTRTEAYLAYKAGVIQQSDLKPSLAVPRNGIDAWLAYWTGLTTTYPKNIGKNLFNLGTNLDNYFLTTLNGLKIFPIEVSDRISATISGNTLEIDSYNQSNWCWLSKWVEIPKNTKITVSAGQHMPIKIVGFNNGSDKGTELLYMLSDDSGLSFDSGDYDRYAISLYPHSAGTVFENIQIEKGSTATPYEPYTGEPLILQEEEAYIAYLCGVINEYPEKCLRRVGAYLRYLISARWGRPDHPLNREELYLSLLKTQFIPSGDPSSDIEIDGTAKAAFVDVKMYGDTFQQSYEGKNLLQLVESSRTISGVTLTLNSDGTFGLAGTATADIEFSRTVRLAGSGIVGDQSYTISSDAPIETFGIAYYVHSVNSVGQWNKTLLGFRSAGTQTAATPSTDYIKFVVRVGNGTTVNYPSIKTMIEAGSSATSYEPYVGGIASPSPNYPQTIQTVTGEQTVTVVGKNRLRQIDGTYSRNGITATVNNGKITLNGTATATAYIPLSASSDYYSLDLSGAYTLSANRITGVSYTVYHGGASVLYSTSSSQTKTLSGTYENIRFQINVAQGTTLNNVVVEAQLEAGSTATAYEPYSANNYEINLGKNLLSPTITGTRTNQGATVSYAGDKITLNQPRGGYLGYIVDTTTLPMMVKQGQSFAFTIKYKSGTINTGGTYSYRFGVYGVKADNSTERFIDLYLPYDTATPSGSIVGTATSDYVGLALGCYISDATNTTTGDVIFDVQLERGSQATPYASYFTPIELCKLGTYQDYIYKDGEDWKVHKALGKITLNGSEAWYNAAGNAPFGLVIDGALITTSDDELPLVYCDKFYRVTQNAAWSSYDSLISTNNINSSTKTIRIRYTAMANLSAFKAWLASNNTTLYYALATATDTTITNQALIDQLEALVNGGAEDGTTYIKVDATDPNLPGLLYVEAPKYE